MKTIRIWRERYQKICVDPVTGQRWRVSASSLEELFLRIRQLGFDRGAGSRKGGAK